MFKFYIKIYIGLILNTYCLIAKNNSTEIFIFLNYLWVKVLRVFMFLYRLYWGWKKWGSIVTLTNISISQFFLGQLLEYQRFHFPTLDLPIWNSPIRTARVIARWKIVFQFMPEELWTNDKLKCTDILSLFSIK